jgi:hypothetical protein
MIVLELTIYPVMWISLPIRGRVIDTKTQLPIDHAFVVASWRLAWFENDIETLTTEESISDERGHYTIPGWVRWKFGLGHVGARQPFVYVFAPGYAPRVLANECCGIGELGPIFRTQLPVAALAVMPDSPSAQGEMLDDFLSQLKLNFINPPCEMNRVPRMLEAIQLAQQSLEKEGVGIYNSVGIAPKYCKNHL